MVTPVGALSPLTRFCVFDTSIEHIIPRPIEKILETLGSFIKL